MTNVSESLANAFINGSLELAVDYGSITLECEDVTGFVVSQQGIEWAPSSSNKSSATPASAPSSKPTPQSTNSSSSSAPSAYIPKIPSPPIPVTNLSQPEGKYYVCPTP